MNALAPKLGLSPQLRFHDVYSLTEPSLLALIPRPCLALLAIIPHTPAWTADRTAEDKDKDEYQGVGVDEPVIWFKQTIGRMQPLSLLRSASPSFDRPGRKRSLALT